MEHNRIKQLQNILIEKKIDAFLVTHPANIIYLTDFVTLAPDEREAFVLVTHRNVYLFSDGRYQNREHISFQFRLLTSANNLIKHLKDIVIKERIKTLGFEREDLKWGEYETITKQMPITLFPLDKIIMHLRMMKDAYERDCIEKACAVGDQSLQILIPHLKPGRTEKEIAFMLETIVRNGGYELSFDPIVAFDQNSAIPHYNTKTGEGIIKQNSIILIDYGVKYKGYCSDITRMFFVGDIYQGIKKEYVSLKQIQQQTIEQIQEGNTFSDLDLYCRKKIINAQLPDYPHSTGHGVGLEIHEYPKVSTFSEDRVCEGQVFTIEPGIYYPGKWGMRLEDTVTIENENTIKILTRFPKDIIKK
jgi:Xaa-Pro aminopeptidase